MAERPRVSVGLPVRNGENFIAETLTCFLEQTFTDLEVVISDNASTDRTAEICAEFAARDPRVRYIRQPADIGAAENYNAVFEEARGELFTWTAHDDLRSPEWVARAVAALDASPESPVAIGEAWWMEADGTPRRPFTPEPDLTSPDPARRLRAAVKTNPVRIIFGLFRASALHRVPRHEPYNGSDYGITGTIVLLGPVATADGARYFYRSHPEAYTSQLASRRWNARADMVQWIAPQRVGRLNLPSWRRTSAYVRYSLKAPLPLRQRLRLLGALARTYLLDHRGYMAKLLVKDVLTAGRDVVGRAVGRLGRLGRRGVDQGAGAGPDVAPASNR